MARSGRPMFVPGTSREMMLSRRTNATIFTTCWSRLASPPSVLFNLRPRPTLQDHSRGGDDTHVTGGATGIPPWDVGPHTSCSTYMHESQRTTTPYESARGMHPRAPTLTSCGGYEWGLVVSTPCEPGLASGLPPQW